MQQPGLPERAASAEIAVFKRTHVLSDNPVEAAHLLDLALIHSLTLVRNLGRARDRETEAISHRRA
jgi:hypothetical protein